MSRTIKDKPRHYIPENKLKKKRFFHPKEYYTSEPGWWKRMITTLKKRSYFKSIRTKILNSTDLEELDIINIWNKPHVYYW